MKLLFSSLFAAATLAALSVLAACSSESPKASANAGSSAGGAAAGGNAGSTSSGGAVSAAGTAAGGSAAGGTSAGGVSAAGSAGAGTAGDATVEASFTTVKNLIAAKCASGAGCHTEPGNPLQMPVNDNLYMKVTTHVTMNCGMLVNKASPAQSALVTILQGSCGAPSKMTPRMPFQTCADGDTDVGPDAPCVAPATIAAIQAWISKGAPQ